MTETDASRQPLSAAAIRPRLVHALLNHNDFVIIR